MHACILSHFSRVRFCATLWNAAHQTPLSMGFSRQEYWSGLPFPSLISIYYLPYNKRDNGTKTIESQVWLGVCVCVCIYIIVDLKLSALDHSLYSPFDVILCQLWSVGTFFYVGFSLFLTWPIDLWKCPYFLAHRDLADPPCSFLHHAWNQTFPSMSLCCF